MLKSEVARNTAALCKGKAFPGCLVKLDGCSGTEQSWELCKAEIIIFRSKEMKQSKRRNISLGKKKL